MARMDAVKSDLYWIRWKVPVGLKVQRAFETACSVFLISLRQAIWQRWDVVWKGHGQGQHGKDLFQKTLLLCIVHAQGSCLVIIWHIHTFSSDKVTPSLCGWGRCKTDSSTQKRQHCHTSSHRRVCFYDCNLGMKGCCLVKRCRNLLYDSKSCQFFSAYTNWNMCKMIKFCFSFVFQKKDTYAIFWWCIQRGSLTRG